MGTSWLPAVAVVSTAKDSLSPSKSPWRAIKGFVGYRVSKDGRVWSCRIPQHDVTKGVGELWREVRQRLAGKIPYRYVELCVAGKKRKKYVAPLVLTAFVGPCPAGYESCHFPDRDPADNRLENLKWGSPKENAAHKRRHGTVPGAWKVTSQHVKRIVRAFKRGETLVRISKREKLHVDTIRRHVRRSVSLGDF